MQAVKTTPRLALSNILFTTDFSQTSDRALTFALALASWYGATVHLLHAVTPEPHYSVPLEPLPLEMDTLWQDARDKMQAYESSRSFGEVRHELILEHGTPWDVVSRVLRTRKIDLLVLGTHGREGIKKIVLGSQAEIIFRQAGSPVLTVGPHVPAVESRTWKPKNIIFATDFSESSLNALPLAFSIAEETDANLLMIHLTPLVPMDYKDDTENNVIGRLKALLPQDAADWCKPEFMVRFEFPAEGILRLADERRSDLIIVGVRKRTMPVLSSHSPWATASTLVARASCPVLTVRS
ncbi:MAG TPA: universal stress protein [Terriglobales bacterium]|nr:universal stress protein [Terriglobales bacterium]